MPKKTVPHKGDLDRAVVKLGDQPGKADVTRALGKPVATPNSGRLNKAGEAAVKLLTVTPTNFKIAQIAVVGQPDSPFISHNWSGKAIREMLGKHMGYKPEDLQQNKDPFQDFLGSLYRDRLTGEMQIKSIMFKAAMLECIRQVPGVSRPDAMQALSIVGEFSPLYGKPMNRLDPVKIGPWNDRVSDLRFRAEYRDWLAVLKFEYDPKRISDQAIVNLLNVAGTSVGVGDWRIDRCGTAGKFSVFTGTREMFDAEVKRLGRWKVSDLTPDNSGTNEILAEVGLDAESVKMLGRAVSSPGPKPDSNGIQVESIQS